MKYSAINLENISLARILAEISTERLSGLLEIKQYENEPIVKLWFINNKIVAVTKDISLVERIKYHNWLKPQLVVSLTKEIETLRQKTIGDKLSKVYNFSPEQIKQLFREQLKELYDLFSLERGIVEIYQDYPLKEFPYLEMTGYDIKLAKAISKGLEQNNKRYLDDFPETCLTIKSTNSPLDDIEFDRIDLVILKFVDSNKTIKQIAKESKIPILELQQKAYLLQLMDKVDFALSTNRLLKLTRNNKSVDDNRNLTNFEYSQNWKVPLQVISGLNLLIIAMTAIGFFVGAEREILNLFFRWRGTTTNQDITLITVSDEDIERFPSYPIADEYLAEAIQNTKKHQPTAIGLDIYRNIAQPPGNEKLLDVYRDTDNLIGVRKLVGNKVSPAPILAEKNQVGFSDLIIDSDNIVRRSLLSVEDEEGNIDLSLGAYLALFALSKEDIVMDKSDEDKYILGEASFKALNSHSDGYWGVNNDFNGLQTLLNYQHKTTDFARISFWDVYQDRIPAELINNKIVLIGVIADSEKDFVYTPFSKNKTGLAEPIPGVTIQANVAAQLLNSAKGKAPMLKVLNKPTAILLIIGFSLVGITVGILSLKFYINVSEKNRNIFFVFQILLLSAGVLGISYICFLNGFWISVIASMIAANFSLFVIKSQYKQQLGNLIYADKITKTANRKYFDRVFGKIFDNAKTYNREFALVFCKINSEGDSQDNYLEHNKKLKAVAKAISEYKSENDLVARYDRNSLAIICPNANREEAEKLIYLIRIKIQSHAENIKANLEISFGYDTSEEHVSSIDLLMVAVFESNRV